VEGVMIDEECVRELFSHTITIEGLDACVHEILKKVELVEKGRKIVLTYKGRKIGHLIERVPLGSLKVSKYWEGPLGIKTELSYNGHFAGVLMIEK
jgi:hypothetical protein